MTDDPGTAYAGALARAEKAVRLRRSNAALLAYAEAAAAAPDQVAPYLAMGGLQLAAGRDEQALDAFDGALRRAPRDETALRGRADALERLGRPADAAAALDVLAVAFESDGRHLEAMIASRRALELAESRPRRRTLTDVVTRVRARSLTDAGPEAAITIAELEAAEAVLGLGDRYADQGTVPAGGDTVAALELADRSLALGDRDEARRHYLEAAHGLAAADLRDAALDACFDALAIAPDDLDVHLALASIYARAGWLDHLEAKADVVRRFLLLQPDDAAQARLASIVAEAKG